MNDEPDFQIDDDVWFLKKSLENQQGRFIIFWNTAGEFCSYEFEISANTVIAFSESYLGFSDDKINFHIYRLKSITHIRKVLETNELK